MEVIRCVEMIMASMGGTNMRGCAMRENNECEEVEQGFV